MEIFSLLLPGNFSAPKARDKEGFPQKSCVTFGEVGEQSPRTEDLSIFFGCLCLKKDFYMVKLKLKKLLGFLHNLIRNIYLWSFFLSNKDAHFLGVIVDLLLLQVVSTFSRYGSVASKRQPWSSVLAQMISWEKT